VGRRSEKLFSARELNVQWKLSIAERLASLASVAALSALWKLWGFGPTNPAAGELAIVCALSLAHPGLGPAALLAYLSLSLAPSSGVWLVLALTLALPAAMAFRFWLQAALWLAALLAVHRANAVSYVALAALARSLQQATPSAAAALMAFYALAANLKLAASLPPGTIGCSGLVVAAALTGEGERPLELIGEWFRLNFLGAPRLLFQAAVYAVSGAAVVKGSLVVGRAAAPLSVAAVSLAQYAVAARLGLNPDLASVVTAPLMTALFSLAPRSLRLKRESLRIPEPPPLLEHLNAAWIALYRLLKRGERVLLVCGPRGCGKTALIAEVCAASGLELARDGDFRGKIVHVENAENVADLEGFVKRALRMGARCVVLETSRPAVVAQKLKGLSLRKAVYVPPPDQAARARILQLLLGTKLDRQRLLELASATEDFSLRALIHLAECIRGGCTVEDTLQVVNSFRSSGVAPLLTEEELKEIQEFTCSFKGLLMGFAA